MQISILQDSASGTPVYVETQIPTTNANGWVSIEIGGGIVVSGNFAAIDWANDTYFIKTETDPAGGTNYTITGTSQLLSVPYALHAKTAINATETEAYVDALSEKISELEVLSTKLEDIEGNLYDVVKIGDQIWMAENLKTTKYNDGTDIPLVTDSIAWCDLSTGAYCWYNNDEATYKNTYGALYNWYTVDTVNLCPTGWHVPSDAAWTTVTDYLGGDSVAGGKLKETGTIHWTSPNTGATNETGFTTLPGGKRIVANGEFDHIGYWGFWWSATENTESIACYRFMQNNAKHVVVYDYHYHFKQNGFSVRCLRD
jgi:uncharacterized protein (TIGR02145 family)